MTVADGSVWRLFPFATVKSDGESQDGSLLPTPQVCKSCRDLPCLESREAPGAIATCRFGVDYARLDEERVVRGFIAADREMRSQKSRRMARRHSELIVKRAAVEQSIRAARSLGPAAVSDFSMAKEQVLKDLRHSPEMQAALAAELRREFDSNLDQSHDFLQLVKLVRGHAEAMILKRFPDLEVTQGAERNKHLGAIYFSTELMLVKMDALVFLREVNLALGDYSTFQLHPLMVKYVRIYSWQASQKNVAVLVLGECYRSVTLNTKAVGVVVQGLMDNMVKYAPANSKVSINFDVDDVETRISFSGLGPRIEPGEREKIFLPGFRGKAARTYEESGLGIGLATARNISDALDLGLDVVQSTTESKEFRGRFETSFVVRFPAS